MLSNEKKTTFIFTVAYNQNTYLTYTAELYLKENNRTTYTYNFELSYQTNYQSSTSTLTFRSVFVNALEDFPLAFALKRICVTTSTVVVDTL